MSYKDKFNQALDKGKTKQVTTEILTWDSPNQSVVGELVDITEFSEGKFDTNCSQYILDTDQGRISTVLGSATDKQLQDSVNLGDLVKITFLGKTDLEDGRKVNRFKVEVAG